MSVDARGEAIDDHARFVAGDLPANLRSDCTPHVQERGERRPRPKPVYRWSIATPTLCDTTSRYGRAALIRECEAIRALTGKRWPKNQGLFRAAIRIANLVAGGEIEEGEARSQLLSAASALGLKQREVHGALRRAFELGMASPRSAKARA